MRVRLAISSHAVNPEQTSQCAGETGAEMMAQNSETETVHEERYYSETCL